MNYGSLSLYRERLPEMADFSYMSVPRHCGGSHTLTHPFRRYVKLQQFSQSVPPVQPEENTMLAMMKVMRSQVEREQERVDGHWHGPRVGQSHLKLKMSALPLTALHDLPSKRARNSYLKRRCKYG